MYFDFVLIQVQNDHHVVKFITCSIHALCINTS